MLGLCGVRSLWNAVADMEQQKHREQQRQQKQNLSAKAVRPPPFVFTVLPKDLCLHILVDWLGTMEDLSVLDIACCNSRCRREYHAVLSGKLAFGRYPGMDSPRHISWLYKRGMCANTFFQLTIPELPKLLPSVTVFHTVRVLWLTNHRSIYPLSSACNTLVPHNPRCQQHLATFFHHCPDLVGMHLMALDHQTTQYIARSTSHLSIHTLEICDILSAQNESILLPMIAQWGKSLTSLSLYKSFGYSDRLLEVLSQHCRSLTYINISCHRNALTAQGLLANLSKLSKLTYLRITDGSPFNTHVALFQSLFPHLPRLEIFKVNSDLPLYGILPSLFQHCPRIQHVQINTLKVSFQSSQTTICLAREACAILSSLQLPHPLHTLILSPDTGPLNASSFASFLRAHGSSLTVWDADYSLLTVDHLQELMHNCPRITSFHCRGRPPGLYLASVLPTLATTWADQLVSLTLRNWVMTDDELVVVLARAKKLEQCEISACALLGDETFRNLLHYCPQLKKLRFGAARITPEGIARAICDYSRPNRFLREFELMGVSESFCGRVQAYCRVGRNVELTSKVVWPVH